MQRRKQDTFSSKTEIETRYPLTHKLIRQVPVLEIVLARYGDDQPAG
jgi:hypothetical protein